MSRFFSTLGTRAILLATWICVVLALACGGEPEPPEACENTFLQVDPEAGACRGERCGLVEALQRAAECPDRAFTIEIAEGRYPLETSQDDAQGATALPGVVGRVTLRGLDGVRIERASEEQTEPFRIFRVGEAGDLELIGIQISGGLSDLGGGIYNAGRLVLRNATLAGNQASEAGGAIYNAGILDMEGGVLRDNFAGSFAPGVSAGMGGALFSTREGAARLDRVHIAENRASDGGGIAARGSVEVQRSVFRRNRSERGGGAAVLGGSFVARRSTWHENEARTAGGAVLIAERGVAQIATSTISDNTSFGKGGGVANDGELRLDGSTVFGNWARPGGEGGGLSTSEGGAVSSRASVIAGSRSGGDCSVAGPLRTSDRNLDSDGSCPQFDTADDPLGLFYDLKNYGGDIPTHLPWEDSPVLDARIEACDGPDQRGFARGEDGDRDGAPGCDLGAVELRRSDRP